MDGTLRDITNVPSPPAGGRFAFGLSPADVEEFRVILREECGEDLSVAEAWARATELLSLFKLFLDRELNRQRIKGEFERRSP